MHQTGRIYHHPLTLAFDTGLHSTVFSLYTPPMTKESKSDRQKAAAARALAEAAARRAEAVAKKLPLELGGRDGLEPTRYGDWEKKGILSDF